MEKCYAQRREKNSALPARQCAVCMDALFGSSLQIGDVPLRHGFSICLIHGKDAFLLRAVKTCEGLIDQLNLLLQAAALGIRLLPYAKTVEGPERLPDPGNETVKPCMRYLHNYYREKITLEKLAAHVHLHPNYLCALFKEHMGEKTFDYLTRLRVETAASTLRRENIPVSKLAEQTGFPSESFFYQKFKQYMGMSPKAYRKAREKLDEKEESAENELYNIDKTAPFFYN